MLIKIMEPIMSKFCLIIRKMYATIDFPIIYYFVLLK